MICRKCSFVTDRLIAKEWHSTFENDEITYDLALAVSELLTPLVTKSLPAGWQGDYTKQRAEDWIQERDREGATLIILERSSLAPIGLLLLYEEENVKTGCGVRLGYLLSESVWRQGMATELVQGFVEWCRTVKIASIMGGVEYNNLPSKRVLEKNGFAVSATSGDHQELFYELVL
jgi:ribosomal-protein-alanine N-acetyltransferase